MFRWGGVLLRAFALFSFFISLQSLHAASFDPDIKWQTIQTEHFNLHYDKNMLAIAKKVALYLEEAHTKLSKKIKWKPWGRTQVILSDFHDQPNGHASVVPYNWMLLRVAPPGPDDELANYDDWLRLLVMHEYTHILHLDQYGGMWTPFRYLFGKMIAPNGTVTNWYKEGIATLEESYETAGGRKDSSYTEMLLRTAILQNNFPKIDQADGVQWKWPGGKIQYLYGVAFLHYLAETYGEESLSEFNQHYSKSLFSLWGGVNRAAKKTWRRPGEVKNCSPGDLRFVNRLNSLHEACETYESPRRGKTFYQLWDEWQASLEEKYASYQAQQPTPFKKLKIKKEKGVYLSRPHFSADGKTLYYLSADPHRTTYFKKLNLKTGKAAKVQKGSWQSYDLSSDGSQLAYSQLKLHKRYNLYYDFFVKDLEKKKITHSSDGLRAKDPAFSPDGKELVYVMHQPDHDQLILYDLNSKTKKSLIKKPAMFTQFAAPQFSPDGKKLVVAQFQLNEGWDLFLINKVNGKKKRLTQNKAVEAHPIWSPDGRYIYYTSDQSGIYNVYRMQLTTGQVQQVTDVLTGVFQPALSPDGKSLVVRYYNGEGFDLRQIDLNKITIKNVNASKHQFNSKKSEKVTEQSQVDEEVELKIKKYSPFGLSLFLPRTLAPGAAMLNDAFLFTAVTGGRDPLSRHIWNAGINYRTDSNHLGYFGNYTYNRWRPIFGVGMNDYAVGFGEINFLTSTGLRVVDYFEERRGFHLFASYPFSKQSVSLSYFYQDRFPKSNLTTEEASVLNLGIFSGFSATYQYGEGSSYPASISPIEKGTRFRFNTTVIDSWLGANGNNEQRILSADLRQYVPLGGNHVLALRAGGGYTFGDPVYPGAFSMGGSLGEGILAGSSSLRYFPLRGLPYARFSRDKVILFSAEYRLPLISVQRGIGTWPVFVNDLHMAFFVDSGDAWSGRFTNDPSKNNFVDFFNDFVTGVGAEIRGDFVLGRGLPVTGRLGYAILVTNRNRVNGFADPLFGQSVKNGIFILQWGTSF